MNLGDNMGYFETLKYSVLIKHGKIEIREYANFYLANTKTLKDPTQNSGFVNVFNYISGQNEQKEKISMTTPVVTSFEDDKLVTGFLVPSKFDRNSIPKPTSPSVFIEDISSGKFIAIRFSGRWNEANFDKHDSILLDYVDVMKLTIHGKRMILRYQPPFIPSFLRRNEIIYRLK